MTDADHQNLPHFIIKNNFQKDGRKYKDIITPEVLLDVCHRITGVRDYTVDFDNEGYNIGRLAILLHGVNKSYVSFSENEIRSRNSSFQSFPSALSRFILDDTPSKNKSIYFYILPNTVGNFETEYFIFMYRLMKTAGTKLLNINEHVSNIIVPFTSPEDIVLHKQRLNNMGAGNKPTYITRGGNGIVQVYGKTYGANKYESTLLCIALASISHSGVELYEVQEGGLNSLPEISKDAILKAGAVSISTSTKESELKELNTNDSLRSSRFIYNLLERYGNKKCAFCECEIPQIIQGAHIWPVAAIKQEEKLSLDEKLEYALDSHNGLWLCENHHKLLDSGMLLITSEGEIRYNKSFRETDASFLKKITTASILSESFVTGKFANYVNKRNRDITEAEYVRFV